MKLLIAIPTNDHLHYKFAECLAKLVEKLHGIEHEIAFQNGTLVYVGRDKLARKAFTEGFTHILWLDSDMVFSEDVLDDLLLCGKPFVTGIAHGRRPPHMSCIFTEIYPGIKRWEGCKYPLEPFKIAGCGMACVLMETGIVKDVYAHHSTAFFPTMDLGEDLAFCKRATDLGHEIWVEPTVKLGHVGSMTIYPEYEETYQESLKRGMPC